METRLEKCPFCGSKKIELGIDSFGCVTCCTGPIEEETGDFKFLPLKWNNAYCWKELTRTKDALKVLREGLKEIKEIERTSKYWDNYSYGEMIDDQINESDAILAGKTPGGDQSAAPKA